MREGRPRNKPVIVPLTHKIAVVSSKAERQLPGLMFLLRQAPSSVLMTNGGYRAGSCYIVVGFTDKASQLSMQSFQPLSHIRMFRASAAR